MSEKTIITTTLVGSHVCIAEADYDLLTLSANDKEIERLKKMSKTFSDELEINEKEFDGLHTEIELRDKEINTVNKKLRITNDVAARFDDENQELKARNELLEKVADALQNLVDLKKYKNEAGKDAHYIGCRPIYWNDAEKVLKELK